MTKSKVIGSIPIISVVLDLRLGRKGLRSVSLAPHQVFERKKGLHRAFERGSHPKTPQGACYDAVCRVDVEFKHCVRGRHIINMAQEREMYDNFAPQYEAIENLPGSTLYQQLVEHALGSDCSGLTVLDLGGGMGLHARKAIDRGAAFVDNVDNSPKMIEFGKAIDERLGRAKDRIRWFLGDISEPLERSAESPLDEDGYDIVMVNWTFEHAETMKELEAMWANSAAFCKPGGKFISIRMANPWAKTDSSDTAVCRKIRINKESSQISARWEDIPNTKALRT